MFSPTPNGLDEIVRTFGRLDRVDFEARYLTLFRLPYTLYYDGRPTNRARCHALLVQNFQAAFEGIKAAGLQDEARNYGGIFMQRPSRTSPKPSTHSWGIAIDIEPAKYPLEKPTTKVHLRLPQGIIDAFKAAGFMYGGDFKGTKDPMHFQFATGY